LTASKSQSFGPKDEERCRDTRHRRSPFILVADADPSVPVDRHRNDDLPVISARFRERYDYLVG
jgi:hypothetical protein